MARGRAVWGIELGQSALRGVKLAPADDNRVDVLAFDSVDHEHMLSQPEVEIDELVRETIEKFVANNSISRADDVVIGVPGQQTFSRFVKLPPGVQKKQIPDLVKFEANQQIPFDMDDVVWDYEVFQAEDMPETEVGIFAMRKDLVRRQLDRFASHKITPIAVQNIPSALFNYAHFDLAEELDDNEAVVVIDVGATNTDLVIVEKNSAWSRNIPLGGDAFTDTLVKNFKLSYAKAEQLKRTAATSKHARQIFQTMRPVFSELVAEVQRSVGFYSSTHRDIELKHVLAVGNAFKLPGLQKYLETNLTIPGGVKKLDGFERAVENEITADPKFKEAAISLAASYGLALQGLDVAKISSNLLPIELARLACWKRKQYWWVATAACLGLAAFLPYSRNASDGLLLAGNATENNREIKRIVDLASQKQREFQEVSGTVDQNQQQTKAFFELFDKRALLPKVYAMVLDALPQDPQIANVASPEALRELVKDNPRLARANRKQIFVDELKVTYAEPIDQFETPREYESQSMSGASAKGDNQPAAQPDDQPGFFVYLRGRSTFGGDQQAQAAALITQEFFENLRALGKREGLNLYVPETNPADPDHPENPRLTRIYQPFAGASAPTRAGAPGRGGLFNPQGTPLGAAEDSVQRDPVTGEDISDDWEFTVIMKVKIGAPPEEPEAPDAAAAGGPDAEE